MNPNKGSTALIAIVVVLAIAGTLFAVSKSKAPDDLDTPNTLNEEIMEEKQEGTHDEISESTEGEENTTEEISMEISGEINFTGNVLAGEKGDSPLIDFNQADYQKALESDKLVVLYFYANWCPTCKIEVSNGLNPAFNSLEGNDVVGFRVSYNDNQTDSNEKDLAKEFGVAYQHTKVFLKNGERVLKSPESWSKSRYLEEIDNAL